MKPVIALLVLAVVAAGGLQAQAQTSVDETRRITVSGESVVYVTPDRIEVALGIETRDLDIMVAKQKNNDILKKALAAIYALGIRQKDVQTDHLSIEPRYRYEYDRDTFLGYFVRNTLMVTLDDTGKVEALISEALRAGINYIHGVSFQTSALRKYRDQARESALKAAREKAEAMANALGQGVGAPIQVNEDSSGWPWSYYSSWSGWGFGRSQGAGQNVVQYAQGGAPPESGDTVALGKIAVRANVRVVFELRR